ncbi:MAG TPA: hypothetical protein VED01_05915 [Burkholderiales bacterium]|nr:hypothetical protein [Burkholderiales bacterium]
MQMKCAAAFVAVLAVSMFAGCSEVSNREDFASQISHKTEREVERFAGKPASVDSADPNRVIWIYKGRTFDVPTRKTDPETDVVFSRAADGKLHVVDVVFK